jgi:hypothetical protein
MSPRNSTNKKDSIKGLLNEDLSDSVVHAFRKIIHAPHIGIKVFLLVFIVATIGTASLLVIQSIMTYFAFEVSSKTRTIYETPTLFPKITFCSINAVQTQYAYNLKEQGQMWNLNQLNVDQNVDRRVH